MKSIILKLTGLKLIGSLIGLLYSILQVRFFGATAEMDAFFVAMTAVYTITSLIQGGQLAEVFLPEYLKQKAKFGSEAAHHLLSAILNRMIVFVGIILIGLYFAAPLIVNVIGPGLSSDFKELGAHLFSLSLVLIFFTLISSFVNTTLNAEQIFGRPELTGLVNGIVSIVILVTFYDQFGVYTLVYALLAGKVIEFLIGMVFLKRIGYTYSFVWSSSQYDVLGFFRVMFTTSGYVGATQLYSITLTAMASFLPEGSLSIFNYVKQLSTKASGILMGPISTVFFSKFSLLVSEGKKNLVNYLKKPLSFIFVITFIIFCFIFVSGEELLRLFWSDKSLTQSEFSIAYLILILNFFGFVFSSTGAVFRKTAVALGNAKQLYKGWIIVQLFSAAYAFISIYFFGVYGLATVLVVNMILMAGVSFYVSEKSGIKSKDIYRLLFKTTFLLFLAGILISSLFVYTGFKHIELSYIYELIFKSAIFGLIILLMLRLYFGANFKNLIFSFLKK